MCQCKFYLWPCSFSYNILVLFFLLFLLLVLSFQYLHPPRSSCYFFCPDGQWTQLRAAESRRQLLCRHRSRYRFLHPDVWSPGCAWTSYTRAVLKNTQLALWCRRSLQTQNVVSYIPTTHFYDLGPGDSFVYDSPRNNPILGFTEVWLGWLRYLLKRKCLGSWTRAGSKLSIVRQAKKLKEWPVWRYR